MSSNTSFDSYVDEQSSWQWRVAFVLALLAIGFGAYGQWTYEFEHQGQADVWSVFYHTLQLFILHAPHLDNPIPWQLHAGRWLAALVALAAVFKGLMKVFSTEWRLVWVHFRGDHVVICGLGRVGLQSGLPEKNRQTWAVLAARLT